MIARDMECRDLGHFAVIFIALLAQFITPLVFADYRDATEALKAKQYEQAAQEFKQLAQLGFARATMSYAELMQKERIADEPYSAAAWYGLAADQGRTKAAKLEQKLVRNMTEAERENHRAAVADLVGQWGKDAIHERLVPLSGGTRPYAFSTRSTKELVYPLEYRSDPVIRTVDLRFEVDKQGNLRNPILKRAVDEPFVRETLKFLRTKRWPASAGCCVDTRTVFTNDYSLEQYGNTRLLKKLRKRAETGSPYRKYYYGFAQELAEALNYRYSSLDSNRWFLQAAQGGYPEAQYIVGARTLWGHFFARDPVKGLRWLEQAAEQGHPAANFLLAVNLGEEQHERASKYLQSAADADHSAAQLYLAQSRARAGQTDAARALLASAADHRDKVTVLITEAVIDFHEDGSQWRELLSRADRQGQAYGFSSSFPDQVRREFARYTESG